MTILVTGCNGLVGQKLAELLVRCNQFDIILSSRHEQSVFDEPDIPYRQIDITNKKMVRSIIDEIEPEVIINAAAYVDVDACERERATAWQVNVSGVEHLLYAAKLNGAKFIQISTDYIFDGKNSPYDEYERPNPINYYGKSKLAAENVIRASGVSYAIARTLFLYGVGYETKANFAQKVIDTLKAGQPVEAADDQLSNPTLADDVAYAILKIIELNRTGMYHIGGPGWMSRFEFAQKIAVAFDLDRKLVVPVKMASLKQEAQRPLKSGFITLKAEVDLGLKTTVVDQGLMMLKSQLREYGLYPGEQSPQK